MLLIDKKIVIKRKKDFIWNGENMEKEYNDVKILSIIDLRASASPKPAT